MSEHNLLRLARNTASEPQGAKKKRGNSLDTLVNDFREAFPTNRVVF